MPATRKRNKKNAKSKKNGKSRKTKCKGRKVRGGNIITDECLSQIFNLVIPSIGKIKKLSKIYKDKLSTENQKEEETVA
jgi:hypothetical protein